MLNSDYRELCGVNLPFQGRQKYMHSFDLSRPAMSEGFEDYLEPVLVLIQAAGAITGTAHMTVDEKVIKRGSSQRKPGPHVDGCFIPTVQAWGHGDGGGGGRWNHYCNHITGRIIQRMPVIVASSVQGCRAWRGDFEATPTVSGDLSHIHHKLGSGEVLPANHGYLLSADCIHESMIFEEDTRRTFLRIALPVDYEF